MTDPEEFRLGVDPGVSGAIAYLAGPRVAWVMDMPTMEKASGKGQQVNAAALAQILRSAPGRPTVWLEKVSAMPGQGVTSVFSFGRSTGVVEGVTAALGLSLRLVTPQMWKKRAGLTGKAKDAARTLCVQSHPEIAGELTRKKDVGRADAILIAEFGA